MYLLIGILLAVLVVVVGGDAGDEGAGDLVLARAVEDGGRAGDGFEEGVIRVMVADGDDVSRGLADGVTAGGGAGVGEDGGLAAAYAEAGVALPDYLHVSGPSEG